MRVEGNLPPTVHGAAWLKAGCSLAYLALMFLVLPYFGAGAMGIGAAVGFTVMVIAGRDRFRSRTGSLVPAVVLATLLWLMVLVVLAIQWSGANPA